MAAGKPEGSDASLPFAALQLLAPPVRLVSAALWKVLKQRDVMKYGVVEEFVTSACETVPGLLTLRHQGKVALGLRGRLILELCSKQPDEKVIRTHLGRIRAPAVQSSSSAPSVRRDLKIQRTVESFHLLVETLLTDPAEREQFFKDEFPVDYGPKFDQELEKLLWEFLIRLDQLLPAPNLAQTVSWLSETPSVLEECARAATQPQLLKILLQHQTCLGHLEPAASLPPNMGDSILASLSLPPSGRVPSNQAMAAKKYAVEPSDGAQTRDETPFITPVIGIISNEDVPIMLSANKKTENLKFTVVKQRQNSKDDVVTKGREEVEEERNASERTGRMKRKQPDKRESDEEEEEEEEVVGMSRSGKKRMSKRSRDGVSVRSQGTDEQTNESDDDGAKTVKSKGCNRAVLETCMGTIVENQQGVKALRLPEDPYLSSIFLSCLDKQPRVVLEKQSVTFAKRSGRAAKSSYTEEQNERWKPPVKATRNQPQKPDSDNPGLDDKENYPVILTISGSPSQQRSNTEMLARPGHAEDYVTDSEDEATKNFKSRLFMRRYYKTKHGTYVPTLREYWKPRMKRRDLLSSDRKRR